MTGRYPQNAPWESRNGYIPPPRFQQLRALDNLKQQQEQFAPGSLKMPPSHSRSPSLFTLFRSKNSTNAQNSAASQNDQPAQASSTRNQGPLTVPYGSQQQPQQLQQTSLLQSPQPSFVPFNQQRAQSRPQSQPQPQTASPNMASDPNLQQTGLTRTPSMQETSQSSASTPNPVHPEIRSVVQLTVAHTRKVYFSGPLVRKLERQADGQKPHKDDGWVEVWAQLGGTNLSIWDMKEIQEASKHGKEVPPSYVNITDAFVQVLGSVTIQATTTTLSKRYTNVLTLNTAGSNLVLFSCPSTSALISWAAALRLASWEKSRLEEIYTAHLLRITPCARDTPTTLVRGKMEGWARIRIAGQTDWKRAWISVQEGTGNDKPPPANTLALPNATLKKKRISLFSRDSNAQNDLPPNPMIAMFASPRPKDRKRPIMTMSNVTQAFGVYPERPELISRSTLIKVEGTFGDDDIAANLRLREGWVLIMPELEGTGQSAEMLKWIIALHDAFDLYGRPNAWTWDPRDPVSLMFGYPVGPLRDNLFLDRDVVEKMDPRDDRTSFIRAEFKIFLNNHIKSRVSPVQQPPTLPPVQQPPTLPPIASVLNNNLSSALTPGLSQGTSSGPQLPPFSFSAIGAPTTSTPNSQERTLTSIMERRSTVTNQDRALSFIVPSTMNDSATEKNGRQQQQPSLDTKLQPAIPSEANATSSPSDSQGPPTPIPTPSSMLTLDTRVTKIETRPEPPSLTLNISPTVTLLTDSHHSPTATILTNPHHSPTMTVLTNPHYSPTQSVFTNPHHGSDSPTTINFNHSSLPPLGDLDNTSSSAKSGTPIAHSASITTVSSPAKSEASISPRSQTGFLRSPLRSSFDEVQDSSTARLAIHSTQPFPNVLLENARIKTQDSVANQSIKDESVNDQHQTTLSEYHNESLPTPTASSQQLSVEFQRDDHDHTNTLTNAAGALYYMQQSETDSAIGTEKDALRRQPTQQQNLWEKANAHKDEAETSVSPQSQAKNTHLGPLVAAVKPTGDVAIDSSVESVQHNNTTSTVSSWKSPVNPSASSRAVGRLSPTRSGLGRKPSGARAQLAPRSYNRNGPESFSSQTLTEEEEEEEESMPEPQNSHTMLAYDDANAEALAALTYLDIADSEDVSASATPHRSPIITSPSTEPPKFQLSDRPIPSTMLNSDSVQFRSSFAPSSKVAERILKAQAQQAAHEAAKHRPGRANGKKAKTTTGAWESSDEEEEEEDDDEEDEDVDSDPDVPMMRGPQSASSRFSSSSSAKAPQSSQHGTSDSNADGPPSHLRPPRHLPPVPPGRAGDEHYQPQIRRMTADHQQQQLQQLQQQYGELPRRAYLDDGTQIRTQAEVPHPGAARQNVWSQVLDPGRGRGQPEQPPIRDTFVQLEPTETMTKAFTPQGLLSAGLQDKEDRSAKRQEELARESGGSLINVPNKPPPPQTGLLGAITAHERERKREGGVGAALTEREREKRVAEERQRKFDEHQRQQLDQMQQGGSMYGGYNPMMGNPMMMGMNPMMGMSPMMTGGGLNPMMTGGGMQPMNPMMTGQMGFPGMMGGFNPHMFAAQQAAQAYQQAMMAFSVAGSQVGPPDGGGGPSQGNQNMNPGMMQAMTPAMTGGMGGYDPRMSMMGMPMMGMGMGLPPMGGQMPLGMQMTGMSTFDPRASPGNGGANGNNNEGNLLPPINPNAQFSSRTSSPAGRGSPLARNGNDTQTAPDRARPSSPNPK